MTAAQADRRRRVLHAVIELARDADVDAVSMKDIADRSGVALGTIYRYFSSKDHVIGEALLAWASGIDRPGRNGGNGADAGAPPAERLAATLRRALKAYEREPVFARLLIATMASDDPFASKVMYSLGNTVFGALESAVGDGVAADDRDEVFSIIGAVWFQGLTDWVKGRRTIDDVRRSLEAAVRLLLT